MNERDGFQPVRSALLEGPFARLKGRGARTNRDSRFSAHVHEADPEFLEHERRMRESEASGPGEPRAPTDPASDEPAPALRTQVTIERARTIISRNDSPDIPFDRSINPYRGCEHGCVYCYARPTHAYLGLSPGLDFETRIFAKRNAAELLERELRRPGYRPALIALGANTDPYQPAERDLRITRAVLETLSRFRHPVGITTKSALILRDIDLLRDMARDNLVRVWISLGSLDPRLARSLEPRASSPVRRLEAVAELARNGIVTGVLAAPLIPGLSDAGMEQVLEAAVRAGARHAGYTVLRLPYEVRDLFVEWLEDFAPLRAGHVMSLVRQARGGRDNQSEFGTRMSGTGSYAVLLSQRFELACRRLGIGKDRRSLDTTRFAVPAASAPAAEQRQASLF